MFSPLPQMGWMGASFYSLCDFEALSRGGDSQGGGLASAPGTRRRMIAEASPGDNSSSRRRIGAETASHRIVHFAARPESRQLWRWGRPPRTGRRGIRGGRGKREGGTDCRRGPSPEDRRRPRNAGGRTSRPGPAAGASGRRRVVCKGAPSPLTSRTDGRPRTAVVLGLEARGSSLGLEP